MRLFGGDIRVLLDFLPHIIISRVLVIYLSFCQTAGIRYPRMPMYVYNLDGPFNALHKKTSNKVRSLSKLPDGCGGGVRLRAHQ